ncbi:MAG: helix-turn-helix transcriptional regulator [Deltaproteobacteria bacterium]|nr:helix-turn-helix transcriptional regulator [Deltaproteobacteria bacterium]
MEPNKIKALLVERGITITSIARKLGVSQPTVTLTIQGKTVSAKVRTEIASAIGRTVAQTFQQKAA